MPTPRWLFQIPWRTRRQIRSDFEEELSFHHDMRVAELLDQGRSRAEAEAIVARESGDVDDARRYVNSTDHATESTERRRDLARDTLSDIRTVARRLARTPAFTVTALMTLALGVGACVLMFNIIAAVLIAPLPFKNADRIVMVWGDVPQVDLGFPELPIGGRYFSDIRANAHDFASIAAFRAGPFNLETADAPQRVDGVEATGDFFDALGVAPALGRFFTRENEAAGNDGVVVISDELWHRSFGGDPRVLGRVVTLNARPYTIIGVAPAGFGFPRASEMPGSFQFPARSLLWVPLDPPKRGPSDLALVGRLRDGVSLSRARADLDRVRAIEERLVPQGKGWFGTMVVPLHTQLVGHAEPMLVSLLAAVGLLLALACLNTAQLQVARLQARRRELAVRAALGASGGRLASELAIEVIVLVLAGGALGTLLAWSGLSAVRAIGAGRVPRLDAATFDPRAAGVALLAALIAGLLASVVPALFAARVPLVETLRGGGRGVSGASSSIRARRSLIVAELTLCVVLVASAGLLERSLSRELRSATGFTAPDGITFEVTLAQSKYPEKQGGTYMEHPTAAQFFAAALDRIRRIPGVDAAAIGKPLPLSGSQEASGFTAESAPPLARGEQSPVAEYTIASPDMFRALGTPIVAGRDFDATDRLESPRVVMVNKAMADWMWPGQQAVGKRLHLGGPQTPAPWMTVIGVSANMKRYSLTESPRPEMIVPYTQNPYPSFLTMQFVVRSVLSSEQLVPELRRAIGDVDRSVPISHVRTISELVGETSANARFAAGFMTAFGAAALALAMIGVYGLVAFTVQQRRQEFGVRRALGAAPRELMRLVVREGLMLACVGIGVGLVIAVAGGFALRHLLYQIAAYDPFTLAATIGLLTMATIVACVGPAWRAARVEARVALEE